MGASVMGRPMGMVKKTIKQIALRDANVYTFSIKCVTYYSREPLKEIIVNTKLGR